MIRNIKKGSPSYSEYLGLSNNGYYTESDKNGFSLIPNFKGTQINQDRNLFEEPKVIPININSEGFRVTRSPLADCNLETIKKILFLGDSFTFGVYLRDYDTYPSRFQYLFNSKGQCVQIINAGFANGFEADQIHSWLYQNIEKYNPSIIIYNIFGGNDILGINKDLWVNFDENGMPIEWKNKNLYVKNGILRSKNKKAPLTIYYLPILRQSKFLATFESKFRRYVLNKFILKKERGLTFNSFAHLYGIRDRSDIENKEFLFIKIVDSMNKIIQKNGGKFYTVYLPANFEVYPKLLNYVSSGSTFIKSKDKSGNYGSYLCDHIKNKVKVNCLDITNRMNDYIKNSMLPQNKLIRKNIFFPRNGEIHMSKNGADFTAKEVFTWISDQIE